MMTATAIDARSGSPVDTLVRRLRDFSYFAILAPNFTILAHLPTLPFYHFTALRSPPVLQSPIPRFISRAGFTISTVLATYRIQLFTMFTNVRPCCFIIFTVFAPLLA